MSEAFANRSEAGSALAARLANKAFRAPVVVLALPRGGVPVAAEVARALHAPLELLLVRKIGAPWQPELAVAAVVALAEGACPEIVYDERICALVGVDRAYVQRRAAEELQEIERRRRIYLGGRVPLPLAGATVIVVDDGIATGTTVRAALRALRRQHPARIVLAVPVAPADSLTELRGDADEIVCLVQPAPFRAVGLHYRDFHQVGDEEVIRTLRDAAQPLAAGAPPP